jgi:hypothetical protein
MQEARKILPLESNSSSGWLAGSAEEQRGGDILGTQYRHGDFRLDPPAPEICRQVTTALPITATMNPFKQSVTTINGFDYTINIFDNIAKLKEHAIKHVLNPMEAWSQLENSLDIPSLRAQFIEINCISRYVGSVHNNACKRCPNLQQPQCDSLITPIVNTYTSTIMSVVTFQGEKHVCYLDPDGKLVFLDDSGVTVFCTPYGVQCEYVVDTAFRAELPFLPKTLSRQIYFDKARYKYFNKRSQNSRPLVLRI